MKNEVYIAAAVVFTVGVALLPLFDLLGIVAMGMAMVMAGTAFIMEGF